MKEKTLRWPGHAELMRVLKDTGFFSLEPVDLGGQKVRPRDLTAALLFPKWTFDEGEADLTVMRVRVVGREDGKPVACAWDLVDRYHEATGLRSCRAPPATWRPRSRASSPAAGSAARASTPPEALGAEPGLLDHVLADLTARGVRCRASFTPLA